jgi:hypothetical protein
LILLLLLINNNAGAMNGISYEKYKPTGTELSVKFVQIDFFNAEGNGASGKAFGR